MPLPYIIANGPGSWPDAEKYMANWDWVFAMAKGNFLGGPGFELWSAGTSISNPADAAALSDGWTMSKGGTSAATADVSRESTTIDSGTYSMKINITGAGSSNSYVRPKQSVSNFARFASQSVIFSAKVKVGTASKVRLSVYDGVTTAYSDYHTGDNTWQKLTVALACSASITELTVKVEVTSDFTGAIYVDSSFLYVIQSTMSSAARTALEYFGPDDPLSLILGTLTMAGAINEKQGADIASASTINLDTATGNLVDVTGTTTITAVTLSQGRERVVRFTGALTLTHGSSLVLPGAANITTAAGDFAVFRGYASGVVRCASYLRATGYPVVNPTPTVQKFTSGSGTYTTPAGVKHIRVRLVGAGGGGAGSSTNVASDGGSGGAGGNTTFGSSLLAGNGGSGGTKSVQGAGGSGSLGTGPIGLAIPGGSGGPSTQSGLVTGYAGGDGGASALGGNGGGGSTQTPAPTAGGTNTGGGGGGAGINIAGSWSGCGGGAGGFVDAIIAAPAATYAYAVGAAGTAGAAGTTGTAGAAGGSGVIVVEEYYV